VVSSKVQAGSGDHRSRFSIFDLEVSKWCKHVVSPPVQKNAVNLSLCAWYASSVRRRFSIFDFRSVELAWDNANNRTGSSNHEKPHKSNAGQVRSEPVSASGATVISRLQFTTGAGYRRGRARPTRPMRSRRPPCHRRQRSRRALLPRG